MLSMSGPIIKNPKTSIKTQPDIILKYKLGNLREVIQHFVHSERLQVFAYLFIGWRSKRHI